MDFEFEKVNPIGNWFHETCTIFRVGIVRLGITQLFCCVVSAGLGGVLMWLNQGNALAGMGCWLSLAVCVLGWAGMGCWLSLAVSVLVWAGMGCWLSLAVSVLVWECVCVHGMLLSLAVSNGGSRISQRELTLKVGCQPIILVNFAQKLHENEKQIGARGSTDP